MTYSTSPKISSSIECLDFNALKVSKGLGNSFLYASKNLNQIRASFSFLHRKT